MRRLAPYALAAAGGALYALGFVGWGLWPLLAVFGVPLWRALEHTRARGAAASALAGLAFGGAAHALGYTWLWRIVDVFLDGDVLVGAALWAAHGLWFAAGFAIYALLFHTIRGRGWPVALAGIPPLLAVEWLHPQIVPVHAGAGLLGVPDLVQAADLGGPLLLSAGVGGANAVAWATWTWLRGERTRPRAAWLAAVGVAFAALGYAEWRAAQLDGARERAPALRVGLVQANLGVLEKRSRAVAGHRAHLVQSRELLREGPVDLLVWPETAYIRGVRRPLPVSGSLIRGELEAPLLFGAPSVRQLDGRRVKTNSAFLVGPDGTIRDAYDKNVLLPLAEYVPLAGLVPGARSWLPHARDFLAAERAPALHLGPWRLSTPICFEVLRPDFVRRMVGEGRPHLLVTLANDAWFGDSRAPRIHLALARLRAVEHRRYLVRSTNSGISAVVDPTGRVVARTGLLTRESLRATVHPLEGVTPYARLGDWPGWLAAVAVTLSAAAPRRRREPPHPEAAFPDGSRAPTARGPGEGFASRRSPSRASASTRPA